MGPYMKGLAVIKTKSNYRGLNGSIQEIYEIAGNRVTCLVYIEEVGKFNQVDFNKDEVKIILER